MNYTTTNSGSTTVRSVMANHRDTNGNLNKTYVTSALRSGETASFKICNSTLINVEAKQAK